MSGSNREAAIGCLKGAAEMPTLNDAQVAVAAGQGYALLAIADELRALRELLTLNKGRDVAYVKTP